MANSGHQLGAFFTMNQVMVAWMALVLSHDVSDLQYHAWNCSIDLLASLGDFSRSHHLSFSANCRSLSIDMLTLDLLVISDTIAKEVAITVKETFMAAGEVQRR